MSSPNLCPFFSSARRLLLSFILCRLPSPPTHPTQATRRVVVLALIAGLKTAGGEQGTLCVERHKPHEPTTDPASMAEEVKPLETARAERRMWLMKCPTVVSRAWQEAAATSNPEAGGANPNPVVAKVVLSLDLLRDEPPTKARLPTPSAPYILWSRVRLW